MTIKIALTPKETEVQALYAQGKSPEHIAIRLNMKDLKDPDNACCEAECRRLITFSRSQVCR